MADDDAAYRPFAELPEFVKKRKIPLKRECAPDHADTEREATPEAGGEEDEKLALSEAMKDVKAITRASKRVACRPPAPKHIAFREENDPMSIALLEETLKEHHTFNVTNLPEYMEGYMEDINPVTLEKLRTGEFSVQKALDLHGHGLDEANMLFEEFIRDAIRSGLHCVKVIHGRGLKSKGVPVLKEELKTWIVKAMHRKWVIAFASSRMRDGGPGATNILLRKRPEKKRIKIIG
jgi:DNA-nicking Smr family endonuclease